MEYILSKQKINWKVESAVLKQLGESGMTQVDLANKYGITRQRMKQIIDKHIPDWKESCGYSARRLIQEKEYFAKWGVRESSDLYRAKKEKFNHKKANAKQAGWTWDISFGDLQWPTHCPILGIELDFFAETRAENSPSFDQIIPGKGYVKGNVEIMSWRANRIKNDGSADEHRQIAEYLDKRNKATVANQE